MQKIIKKKLFRIEFDLASALSIGSGDNLSTDKDVIIDSNKMPYIPASAIAGVCISTLEGISNAESRRYKDYWGYIDKIGKNDEYQNQLQKAIESSLIFYDACLIPNQEYIISVRDCVALDEYKTAKSGAKFDMEVVEPGIRFRTYVEQSIITENDPNLGDAIAKLFMKHGIRFGSKTSRGYGSIDNVSIQYYELVLNDSSDDNRKNIELWAGLLENHEWTFEKLPWNAYEANTEDTLELRSKSERTIEIDLKQVGGISIRQYTTEATNDLKKDAVPDFTQLVSSDTDCNGRQLFKPVIPGTSWAGAFIHQIEKNIGTRRVKKTDTSDNFENNYNPNELDEIFGCVGTEKKMKSKISFSESLIEGAVEKKLSRNALDRFSGGTKDGALFTERTYYGGTTKLIIGIDDDIKMSKQMTDALAAAVVDLHYGFMAVGGETSIGRGLFTITSINGVKSIPDVSDIEAAGIFYDEIRKLIVG